MLLDQVTSQQMQAGQAFTALTMAGFLSAPLFGRFAQRVRIGVAGLYLAGVVVAVIWLAT